MAENDLTDKLYQEIYKPPRNSQLEKKSIDFLSIISYSIIGCEFGMVVPMFIELVYLIDLPSFPSFFVLSGMITGTIIGGSISYHFPNEE